MKMLKLVKQDITKKKKSTHCQPISIIWLRKNLEAYDIDYCK